MKEETKKVVFKGKLNRDHGWNEADEYYVDDEKINNALYDFVDRKVRITIEELPDSEVCCGFGGTFCIKYPEISDKIVTEKINHIQSTAADTLLAGDLGCLLNMAGKLQRCNHSIKVLHVAEVLADMADGPGIGEA